MVDIIKHVDFFFLFLSRHVSSISVLHGWVEKPIKYVPLDPFRVLMTMEHYFFFFLFLFLCSFLANRKCPMNFVYGHFHHHQHNNPLAVSISSGGPLHPIYLNMISALIFPSLQRSFFRASLDLFCFLPFFSSILDCYYHYKFAC